MPDPCPCDLDGICTCRIGSTGEKCNQCEEGYYDIDINDSLATCTGKSTDSIICAHKPASECVVSDCACNINGSLKLDDSVCHSTEPCPCDVKGACTCSKGFNGDKCDECESGYFDLNENELDSSVSCSGNLKYFDPDMSPTILWSILKLT